MDNQLVQTIRYRLQTRVRRVKSASHNIYCEQLRFLIGFLNENSLCSAILRKIEIESKIEREVVINAYKKGEGVDFSNEHDYTAACYWILSELANVKDNPHQAIHRAACFSDGGNHSGKLSEWVDAINDFLVEFLCDAIDEYIDSNQTFLYLLKKYKHRCEWFNRESVQKRSAGGERSLMLDAYSYLHDQGIDFHIEPTTASGKPDLVADQVDDRRVVLDGKLVSEEQEAYTVKQIVAKGFRQVYQYCSDYNEPIGYLLVYKNSGLILDIGSDIEQYPPAMLINGKTIHFLEVDIYKHEKTASARSKYKSVSITKDSIIETLDKDV